MDHDNLNGTSAAVREALAAYIDQEKKARDFYAADHDRANEALETRQENARVKLVLELLKQDVRFAAFKREGEYRTTLLCAAGNFAEIKALVINDLGGEHSLFAGSGADLLTQVNGLIQPSQTMMAVLSIGQEKPIKMHAAGPQAGLIAIPTTSWAEDCAYLILCLPEFLKCRAQAASDFVDCFIEPGRMLEKVHAYVLREKPFWMVDEAKLREIILPSAAEASDPK